MYEISKTNNFRFQYNKLNLRFKRLVDEAIEVIKDCPTEFQGKITHIANRKEGGLYRFRVPGCYILYVVPEHNPEEEGTTLIFTNVKMLR